MDKQLEKALLKIIADNIGVGVHTSLRKYCDSKESIEAWDAISAMPDEEWNTVAEIVAKQILEEIRPFINW